MISRRTLLKSGGLGLAAFSVMAQFTSPNAQGNQSTVSAAKDARIGSYVTLQGSIVLHLWDDYYLFRDSTGEMRVEISSGRFGGLRIGPFDRVRIVGEVDLNRSERYIWVQSLNLAS